MAGTTTNTAVPCPRCGTSSIYVRDYGICTFCQNQLKLWFESPAAGGVKRVKCDCPNCEKKLTCPGITLAACGHVTHGQVWNPEQDCDKCWKDKAPNNAPTSSALGI